MRNRIQVTLSDLFLAVFVYAVALALVVAIGLPPLERAIGICIVTLFVVCDLCFVRSRQHACASACRVALPLAYYSTVFAVATLGCFIGFRFVPFPTSPSPMPEFTLSAIVEPFVRVFVIALAYAMVFSFFILIGFVASLLSLRGSQIARWLLFINCAAIATVCLLICGFCLIAALSEK